MKILLFSQNFENFAKGAYHHDLVTAVFDISEAYVYGPGYEGYDQTDTLDDVLRKAGWDLEDIDYIITGTSWDKYVQYREGDPHPNLKFADVSGPIKIHFVQNEYKGMDIKLGYVQKQQFDYVVSAYEKGRYDEWSRNTGIKVIYSKLAINLDNFRNLGLERKYDFLFTGELHEKYLPERRAVKNEIFKKTKTICGKELCSNKGLYRLLSITNPIKPKYRKYKIYWAERHRFSRDYFGKTLTPHGQEYVRLLNQAKVALCTFSANRQFGLRFYELMQTETLIMCPEDDYEGNLIDGINCIMYKKNMSDFEEKLELAVNDEGLRKEITDNAKKISINQDYQHRLYEIFEVIKKDRLENTK